MALVNPQGLYTGGAVDLDANPYVQFEANILAKKRAKDEALNQYFNDMTAKINTAGVRQQDLQSEQGGINQDIQNWQKNWMANKESIKKGGMAQQQHMSQYQGILKRIDQSKNRAKQELEIGKAKFEGKYDPDDDDIGILDKVGKSIYDKSSYKDDGVSEYGWGDLSPAVGQFDAAKQDQFWKSAERGQERGKQYDFSKQTVDPTTGKAIVPFNESYSKDQIKTIAENAAKLIPSSREAKKHFQKMLDNPNSENWQQANKAYQDVYGKDDIVDSPEKWVKAEAILRASTPSKQGQEAFTDLDTAQKIWEERRAKSQEDAYKRLNYSNTLQEGRKGAEGNDFLKTAMGAIDSGDESKIDEAFSVLNRGGKYVNVKAKKVGDEIVVSYEEPTGVDLDGDPVGGKRIERKIKIDKSLGDNLKGVYQGLTGNDAKFEKMSIPETPKKKETIDFSKFDPKGFKKEAGGWRYKDGKLYNDKGELVIEKKK